MSYVSGEIHTRQCHRTVIKKFNGTISLAAVFRRRSRHVTAVIVIITIV